VHTPASARQKEGTGPKTSRLFQFRSLPPVPDVSVIIPCHNAAPFLREAVDSALVQAGDGLAVEVIVVDDGSTDGSSAILGEYGDRVRLLRQSNQGACAARNEGWRKARSEWIKFLDADDRLLPGGVAREFAAATSRQADHEDAIYFSDMRIVDREGKCLRAGYLNASEKDGPLSNEALVRRAPLVSMPLYPRKALEAVSGFDPGMPAAQEYDLHVRLQFSGWCFVPLDLVGSEYRVHPSDRRVSRRSLSAESFNYRLKAYERHLKLARSALEAPSGRALADAFAGIFWSTGRFALRCGLPGSATPYFRKARSLSPSVPFGNKLYRLTCRLFGPSRAERISELARNRHPFPVNAGKGMGRRICESVKRHRI